MGLTKDVLAAAASSNDAIAEALGGIDKLLAELGFSLTVPKNAAWLQSAVRAGIANAMAKLDGLACALRAVKIGVPDPLDADDLRYVADQRALRAVYVASRGFLPSGSVRLTDEESHELERLTDVWIDGFNFGLRYGGSGPRHRVTKGN